MHHMMRLPCVYDEYSALQPAVGEEHAARQQEWRPITQPRQEMHGADSRSTNPHHCTSWARHGSAACVQLASAKPGCVNRPTISSGGPGKPAVQQVLALVALVALGAAATAAGAPAALPPGVTPLLSPVRVSGSRVLQATPGTPQQVAYDPALPPGTPQEDVLWLAHMPHEGTLSAVRGITLVSGNGSAVPAATLGVPELRSVNASLAVGGRWLRLDVHLGSVSIVGLPVYDLVWSTGGVVAVGNAAYSGVQWRLSGGVASCEWLAGNGSASGGNPTGTGGGEGKGDSVCSVSVYCGGSHGGGVACLGNVAGEGRPSWSPAVRDGDVLLVLYASAPTSVGSFTRSQSVEGGGVPVLADVACERQRLLAVGHNFVFSVLCDGSVWCWGNVWRQLGLPSSSSTCSPVRLPLDFWDIDTTIMLKRVVQLSAGLGHTCALYEAGSLYCWGANADGQLGLNQTSSHEPPSRVTTAGWSSPVTQIHSLQYASFAVLEDGSLWAWGQNHRGQLGLGLFSPWSTPRRVNSSRWEHGGSQAGISVLSGFSYHACVIPRDGSLWCWGDGYPGKLGIGSFIWASSPVQVQPGVWGSLHGEARLVDVACGGGHTCALQNSGTVWCWGQIGEGQLGLGDSLAVNQLRPVIVPGAPEGVVSLEAGFRHTCALTVTGAVWCWGDTLRQTHSGDSSLAWSFVPREVPMGALAGAAVSSIRAGNGFTCLTTVHGVVWCWGAGSSGQLGIGGTSMAEEPVRALLPGAVLGNAGLAAVQASAVTQRMRSVSVGGQFSCGVLDDGSMWCWGSGGPGLLGVYPEPDDPRVPVQVRVPAWKDRGVGAMQVEVGFYHACGVMTDATLWCWGQNEYGQLGVGSFDDKAVPVQVEADRWGSGYDLIGVTHISLQFHGTCALLEDGTVWCWGRGDRGRLGIGSTSNQSLPQQVLPGAWGSGSSIPTVTCMAVTEQSGVALLEDGTVWTWGNNWSGQLGVGTSPSTSTTPIQVNEGAWGNETTDGEMPVVSVHAGGAHACALVENGTLWCWGFGIGGQIGVNSRTDQPLPVQVVSTAWGSTNASAHIVAVDCGTRATCALLDTGAVYCWGDIDWSSTIPDELLPQLVQPGAWGGGVVASVHARMHGMCVITAATGSLWCMGSGGNGRLGLRSGEVQRQPASVTHANADIWSCVQPSTHALPPSLAVMYAVTGGAVPGVRLCREEGSRGGGVQLPPWAGSDSSGVSVGASWGEVHAAVGGALGSADGDGGGGGWPCAASVLPPLGVLDGFMRVSGRVSAADQALYMGAVRLCSNGSASSGQWQVHPWLSPAGGGRGSMRHAQAGTGAEEYTVGDEGGTVSLHCGQWQSALVVLPSASRLPLLVHGGGVSVPLGSAWVMLLDVAATLRFSVLSVQYGSGGGALPGAGGVLLLHLDVQLSWPVWVSVVLRGAGGVDEVVCHVLHVSGSVVSCVAPGGVGEWGVHVSVDGHEARGAVRVQYESRRAVCVGA